MPSARDARKNVKGSLDTSDCRKNRVEAKVELRKAKKDDFLQKRRQIAVVENAPEDVDVCSTTGAAAAAVPKATAADVPALAEVVRAFVAANGVQGEAEALEAVRSLRQLLSLQVKPPIDAVIDAGLVPHLVMLLQHPTERIVFESAWCLTNVASGTTAQCQTVVDANAVGPLVALMASESIDVKEQAVWALGNVAGDCTRYRDLVLASCGVERLCEMVAHVANAGLMSPLRNATWLLSNLMRGKPAPDRALIAPAGPTLRCLLTLDDDELLQDACWALSYLAEADYHDIVVGSGAIPGLLQAFNTRKDKVQVPALRTLSTLLSGDDEVTQAVLEAGLLQALPKALSAPKSRMRKEACWAVSNIAAGTEPQMQSLFDMQLMGLVVQRLDVDEFDVKKEAMWAIANVLHGVKSRPSTASARRVQALVALGALKPMVALLEVADTSMVNLVLEALSNLLSCGETLAAHGLAKEGAPNPFLTPFDEAEGVDKLEQLQSHANEEIYEKAVTILEAHFQEDTDEDQNLAPQANANAFSFGMQQQPVAAQAFAF